MFNMTVCIIALVFLLIHTVSILLKKDRRKDENSLLVFIVFTAIHFAIYLTFTIIKVYYTSDAFIMSFYTTFYIMNNVEAILLFAYTLDHISVSKKTIKITSLVNTIIFGIFVVLDIVNIFTHIFFYSEGGVYQRSKAMIVSQGYQFVAFVMVFILTAFNKKLRKSDKISFAVYCILPLVAIIIQNFVPGYAIAYLSILFSVEILFLLVNVRKSAQLALESSKRADAEIKIMMSQIQPHFTYNTLASISTLIKINPDKAQQALDTFTDYLRANLSSLTQNGLIPFNDEMRHVQSYLSLEKMRFEERLTVVYDVQATDFSVPPLSLQPLVENAVKHGILKKLEGGTITIRSYENSVAYFVEVEDDGVGLDTEVINNLDNKHIGLNNVKYRISTMCHGNMKVESEIDKGTKITLTFYR